MGLGLIQLAVPAHAINAPALLGPNGAVTTSTPTLSWDRPSGTSRFEVVIDKNADLSSAAVSTTNTQYVPSKPLAGGEQHWRVCAIASSGERACSRSSFTVDAVGSPSPVSPVTGSQPLAQPEEPPLLKWQGVQGATEYVVQVDKEKDGVDVKQYKTRTTSIVVPDPLEATTYYWRVKAIRASGVESAFSEWEEFSLTPLAAVTGMSPVGFEQPVDDVELRWAPVKGAAWYELQVALDSEFASLVDPTTPGTATSVKVLGTRYSPATTYDNGTYYWRVRAIDTNGNASPWPPQIGSFRRVWEAQPGLCPDGCVPRTVFPADTDDTTMETQEFSSAPYFQWTPVRLATQYEIQVGYNENFSPDTYETCQVAGTTFTPQMFSVNNDTGQSVVQPNEDCWVRPGVEMYWRVRPLDLPYNRFGTIAPGVQGIFSEAERFVWRPQRGVTLSPAGGEVVDIPTLRWDFPWQADSYRVEIRDAYGQMVGMPVTTRATSYTPVNVPTLQPARGPFTWSVTAYDAQGPRNPGELSHPASETYRSTFNVSGDVPTTGAAPLAPLTGLESDTPTLRAPELSWEPHPDAAKYKLFVGPADADETPGPSVFSSSFEDAFDKFVHYPTITDTGRRFLTPGRYDWWIEAYAADGRHIATGPEETFRIRKLSDVIGQSIAVEGRTLAEGRGCAVTKPALCDRIPATPVLSWDPVEGAAHYMVYVGEGAFTNVVEPLTHVSTVANTMWTPTLSQVKSALKDSEANQAYHWFIRPCKAISECGPNPISTPDAAVNQFRKVSPQVQSITGLPASEVSDPAKHGPALVTTPDVTLDWEDYYRTNQDTTWSVTGEKAPQSAKWYRVQIDNDENFTSPLETVLVDQSRFTSATRLYPEGILWWRVQAIDADDNGTPWSAPRFVKKETPYITPEWPAPGTTVSGNTDFSWEATSSTARYELEVWRGSITENDTTRRLFKAMSGYSDGVKQTAYTWDRPIPASSEDYIWRVRRVDSNSTANRGRWVVGGRFTSRGDVPTLVAPAASATVPANGPVFTWGSVAGAASYVIEVRASGASYNWARVTTAATAWAADRTMSAGSYQWQVIALDAGGAELGRSPARTFSVGSSTEPVSTPTDTTRPTVVRKSPLTYARPGANFVAKFSERVYNVGGTTMRLYVKGTTTRVAARVTLSSDRRTATLNPNSLLRKRKSYTVKLYTGIRDKTGNRLRATSWSVRVR